MLLCQGLDCIGAVDIVYLSAVCLDVAVKEVLERADREVRGLLIDVELLLGEESGLKIPVSAIAEKEFFLIDEEYVTENANDTYTVLMQVYGEDGSKTKSAVSLEVYSYDEEKGVYYVDNSLLSAGDVLFGSDETTFVVHDKGSLIGVYNINKGYADFKEITILYQNSEYAIVKSNSAYGLRYYDYIALDADSVSDDQFISQSK